MSLQVWLPLNGSLRNLGLKDIEVINNGAVVTTTGKIGSCYTGTTASQTIVATLPGLSDMLANGKKYSFACWVKPNTAAESTNGWIVKLGTNTCGLWWGYNTPRLVWNENNNGKRCANGDTTSWHHITVVIDKTDPTNTTEYNYVDGVPTSSQTWDGTAYSEPVDDIITIYPYYAFLNDLRIYDHCLSQKEIKQLSKGLVGHWPLNDVYATNMRNKYSSPYSGGELSSSLWTKTKLSDERGWNYKFTRTGTGTNTWFYGRVPNFSFTAGKTYYYSAKVRCNKWSEGALYLRASRSDNDWATRMITVCSPALADGKWHEYYTYQTIDTDYVRSGTTVTSNPVLEFYTTAQGTSGTIYDMDFDVKDIQVVESDCYVPFIENDLASTTVYDTSGYGHNGIIVSTSGIYPDSSSIRYSVCTKFDEGAYINLGTGGKVTDEITVSEWVYEDTWTADPHPWSCTEGGGWNIQNNNSRPTFPVNVNTVGYVHSINGNISTPNWTDLSPGWHLFTGTYDGFNVKLYIDSELVANKATGKTEKLPIHYHASNPIVLHSEATATGGSNSYRTCKLSDFRIYATVLSDEDIKELYKTSASVDDHGNIWSYQYVETEQGVY